ncbi:MAG: 50S ribosomal protein L23 [Melioribacteraceae bacterium]|nr:50S ribosomal protein L23 [Melioribacteraceae bacterium]MCF8264241.1 50S ribosomal protein L23 [Melioribacteraceae bacterium]MCF8414431.1 50S ribosomal protein L23 [Melioribacteraceae bacterium]
MRNVLIRPLITEKITGISESGLNQFGFVVDYDANKIEIAKAIKSKFGVEVDSVNTMRYKGKVKSQFTRKGRTVGRTSRFKKAIVTLKEGQSIDLIGEV